MKHDNTDKFWKTFEKWTKIIIWILSIPALGVVIYLTSHSPNFYDYPKDSSNRMIQQIACPSYMVKDSPGFITAAINEKIPQTKPTITISITANSFSIQGDTTIIQENMQDYDWITPKWHITPSKTGRQTVNISAFTDDGLSNQATCQIIVFYFFGFGIDFLEKIQKLSLSIIAISPLLGLQSVFERIRASKQKAG